VNRAIISFALFAAFAFACGSARAQAGAAAPDLHSLATQLAAERQSLDPGQDNSAASRSLEDKALAVLDAIVLKALNAGASPDLNAINANLASLAGDDSAGGVSYEVVQLPGTNPVFALVANFSVAGPSAVRLYAGPAGQRVLVAQIDCYNPDNFSMNI